MTTRVIFLDIDGVICCNLSGRLEEAKLGVLKSIVQATQAKFYHSVYLAATAHKCQTPDGQYM